MPVVSNLPEGTCIRCGSAAPLCGKALPFRPIPHDSFVFLSSSRAGRPSLPAREEEVSQRGSVPERRSLSAEQAAKPQVLPTRWRAILDTSDILWPMASQPRDAASQQVIPAPEGRHLENEAGRRAGRRPDIAPAGAQGPMLDAPYPTAGAVGHKMPPASRALQRPELRLTPVGFHPRLLYWLSSGEHAAACRGPVSQGTPACSPRQGAYSELRTPFSSSGRHPARLSQPGRSESLLHPPAIPLARRPLRFELELAGQ